ARERAVRHLLADFLPASAPHLSATDLLKLWKGLFFCFWHADKPLYQADLASRLAAAVSTAATPAVAADFLAAYLATIRREWSAIDVHRLDKFYLLNRRFLHHAFLFLGARSFAPDVTAQIVAVISEKAVLAEADNATGRGLGYHVADVFLDEILPVLPISLQSMELLLAPFFTVLEKSTDRVLVSKVRSSLFERFLESGSQLLEMTRKGEEAEKGSVEEKLGKVGLLFGFSKRFLDIGASAETVQGNRKVVFGLRDAFVKLEKGLELSGVKISEPEFQGTQVPMVAVVENGMDLDEAKVEKKRKKKKAKKAALVEGGEEEEVKAPKQDKKVKKDKNKKEKKEKKKKNKVEDSDGGDSSEQSIDATSEDQQMGDDTDAITFDEALMSNLQKQFEKAAAEAGMPVTPVTAKVAKKRKRSKSSDRSSEVSGGGVGSEGNVPAQDGDKSGKKVRFSMKSNLVWNPPTPLPPQCLRLPPSATPRGSALKSGVRPGPIKESSTPVKKAKAKAKSAKKLLKKSPSSAVKRLRKLQTFSA
ncbi:ribosomal RNA processing protein 1 homolog, partial [Triticum dicoccoides]